MVNNTVSSTMGTPNRENFNVVIKAIENVRCGQSGSTLPRSIFAPYQDLDGTAARRFLVECGFTVVESGDVGSHGYALTDCGICLSTNGFVNGESAIR